MPDHALASLAFLLCGEDNGESGLVHRDGLRFRSDPLPPGSHVLMVRGDFVASQRHELEIAAGEEQRLDLAFEPTGLREVLFLKPPAAKPPRHLSCSVFDERGERVWMQAILRPDDPGELLARVSAVPGSYRLVGETNNGLRADASLEITGWAGEDPPLEVRLFRPQED